MWKVEFYSKETDKFFKSLDKSDLKKIGQELDTLILYGFSEFNNSLDSSIFTL